MYRVYFCTNMLGRAMVTKHILDHDIRDGLHKKLIRHFHANTTTNRVVNEMEICLGRARIDVAVINGKFWGYEIKSPADSLRRLPQQVECYNRVFDRVTVVVWGDAVDGTMDIVPAWWTVTEARLNRDGDIAFSTIRHGKTNPTPDPEARLQLLWSWELESFARSKGIAPKHLKGGRKAVSAFVASCVSAREIAEHVRNTIRNRPKPPPASPRQSRP